MNAAIRYVEAERIDQLAAELQQRGYTIERGDRANGHGYDLSARKNGERIALEVTALDALPGQRERSITVPGLKRELLIYLRDYPPRALTTFAGEVRIDRVTYLDIDAITVTKDGSDIAGRGVVEVTFGGGSAQEGTENADDFPFHFRATVGHDLHLRRVDELAIDVASADQD